MSGRTSTATISPVHRALTTLVNASRVSPVLRDAVAVVEDEVHALEAEVQRLRAQVDRYDAFFDDAFPDDPYLKGCLDGEWDAHRRRTENGSDSAGGAS